MTADRWQQLSTIYHAARQVEEPERGAFVRDACAGDEALQREVESLLAYASEAQSLMERPAAALAAQILDTSMGDRTGHRIGPYTIESLLDAGGMGEVYRARDTKLGRDVAVKILPAAFTADLDWRARFEREARLLAALNHPHIAQIYGLEESGGIQAIVMELVPGDTLAEIIQGHAKSDRGLPLDQALDLARQVADALQAAHEKGIIHRDLKPANIKVTPDGSVKVLDFGLAKPIVVDAASSDRPDPTVGRTREGVIVGTPAYMSPEQACGSVVDKRTDIWAFGCVLYEMLTGRRAFERQDLADTVAAVMRGETDLSGLPPETPALIRRLLARCLQKERKARVSDLAAVQFALDEARHATSIDVTAVPAPRVSVLPIALSLAGGACLAALATWALMRPAPAPSRVERFVIPTPGAASPATRSAASPAVAVSPDGSRVVYRTTLGATSLNTNGVLYLRDRGQLKPTLLRGTEGAMSPFFSSDGERVAFFSGTENALKWVSVLGGPAQTICALDGVLRGGSWGTDNRIVFATDRSKGLRRVSATGGNPEVLTRVDAASGETDHFWPDVLPGGRGVVFTAWNGTPDRSHIKVVSLADGRVSPLVAGGTYPRFAPSGHLVFAVGGALRAVRFDPVRLNATGSSVSVGEDVGITALGAAHYDISVDGALVYASGPTWAISIPRTLVWVDRQGGREEAIPVASGPYTYARLSPDGTRVALDVRDQQNDIWIADVKRGSRLQLTNDPGPNQMPVWAPDGKRVAFTAEREGLRESIYWQVADGSGEMKRLSVDSTLQGPLSFSPDGKLLVFSTPMTEPFALGMLRLDGDRREVPLLKKMNASVNNGEVSPDGHWLAYQSNDSGGRNEVYLSRFPDVGSWRLPVSTNGGTRPLWSKSKDRLELFYYVEPGTIWAVPVTLPVTLGADPTLGTPRVVVQGSYSVAVNVGRHYDVSPDGKRFLLLKDVETANAAKPEPPEIRLVQHWSDELKRLVPTK